VLRGGQLVLAVGGNRQEAKQLLEGKDARLPLVPIEIGDSDPGKELPVLSSQWAKQEGAPAVLQDIEVTRIVPGKGVTTLVRDAGHPVLLEGACGLGRVLVFAFDLDSEKFGAWNAQPAFWKKLQEVAGPHIVVARAKDPGPMAGIPAQAQHDQGPKDLRTQLRDNLENFEDVQPLSFGYVALFILVYILLVGPVDYFILNRVFKRLELTWITFPLTVIGVSVIVYFAAYSMKGSDQRINKIDLVEIDLHEGGQVYGQTWFTLFSPHVQAYTLNLEPAEGAWTGKPAASAPGPAFLLLDGLGERPRLGTQGLFTKPYEMGPAASELIKVPVPVWSTRSVGVSWRAPLPKKHPIGIGDKLAPMPRAVKEEKEEPKLSGKITNNLDTPLLDCALFYRQHWYDLGKIAPGQAKSLDEVFRGRAQGQKFDRAAWFGPEGRDPLKPGLPESPSGKPINTNWKRPREAHRVLKPLMFFRQASQDKKTDVSNVGLRPLDQSWRLAELKQLPAGGEARWRNEAILVARTVTIYDETSQASTHPASPSRLVVQIGDKPTERGFLTQETFVRVYIPVQE
jgi:hypothetical protein